MEHRTRHRWNNFDRVGQTLTVSRNGRFLTYSDGEPFFYLGDTAWELFQRLDLQDAGYYLQDRASKGFTIVQAVLLGELTPFAANAYGNEPLIDRNPAQPNELYFAHVDAIVNLANQMGLRMGLLPSWGSYFKEGEANCVLDPSSAGIYGKFLGERYRDSDVIWILGGDRNVTTPNEIATVRALAEGLTRGDGGRHLKTYHPMGPGQSSDMFHSEDWLSFNMIQSSHAAHGFDNGLMIERDYGLEPTKPTLDGEPRYEGVPAGFYFLGCQPLDQFDDFDCRNAAYWSLLAGACGHTYGHNSIWQMYSPGRPHVVWAKIPWYEAVHHPGSRQMGHVRRLFEDRFGQMLPAQELLLDAPPSGDAKARAARSLDGAFAVVYSPMGEPFTLDMATLSSHRVSQSWFNPRTGELAHVHTGVKSVLTFTPPNRGRGRDWVLLVESV